ncbi:MAG: MCE family protein [Acidimicrobiales bacterium]|nr:MCE family protein [Acidimicrobiales bacterium]
MNQQQLVQRIRLVLAAIVVLAMGVTAWTVWPDKGVAYAAEIADASGVVPRNDVRLNDVIVGHVTSIDLVGLHARVNFELADDVVLPAESRVEIRQTSLLGEFFLALVPEGTGELEPGSVIPMSRTRRAAELESIVASAGGLAAQVNIDNVDRILTTLDDGFSGGADGVGTLFESMARTASSLDQLGGDINATIDSIDSLSAELAPQTGRFTTALDRFADGAEALSSSNEGLDLLISELNGATSSLAELLDRNRERLVRATPVIRTTLQEVVDNLGGLESAIVGLDGFNRGWACASDGNYLNFIFPLTPEVTSVDLNPGKCDNVEEGPAGRKRPTQVQLLPGLDSLTIDDPVGTGDIDAGAGSANENSRDREEGQG